MSGQPIVHLELHTHDRVTASNFYGQLLRWSTEQIHSAWGSYHALLAGGDVGCGIVECGTRRSTWLHVEVERIDDATELARRLGAAVLLDAREGPAGWRSVIAIPAGGEIALWQQKR